ncbi:MAG: hypothetical protein KBB16_03185, partial [Candidatus Pacebacteria bacterium]|nr:hypothetical protein [Candidatus Paceibacterota bacterium]
MNKNIEENLRNIKLKDLSEEEKNQIWSQFTFTKLQNEKNKKTLLFNFKQNMLKKPMLALVLSLVIILGGSGVVKASNSAVPGDLLFGIDKAIEKIELSLASEEKKEELKVRFAEERLQETEEVIKESGSINVSNIDLSGATVTEVEVDVFTNETTVKVEANDKHYGFVTQEKDKAKIINEIKTKYSLTDDKINAVLSFEVEDRASRADDKEFLNSVNSIKFKSEKQGREIKASLDSVADVLADSNLSDEKKKEIGATLAGILTLIKSNPDMEFEVRTKDGFKVEVEDGKVEIKIDDRSGKGSSDDSILGDHGNDVKENANEVLCR